MRSIDAADRRRFDVVLRLDMPPASVRRRTLEANKALLDLDTHGLDAVAEHPRLAPVVVARDAQVSMRVCDLDPDLAAQQVLTRVMNNTLSALDQLAIQVGNAEVSATHDLRWLNADLASSRFSAPV